ncbi:hypothetical protein N9N28_08880 [Rubripirellula amarantea]|nr:hypothetical protein [Rubripirellula amarantea]
MNRISWYLSLLLSLLLFVGCGGESNASKFQRLAKARAAKRAEERAANPEPDKKEKADKKEVAAKDDKSSKPVEAEPAVAKAEPTKPPVVKQQKKTQG